MVRQMKAARDAGQVIDIPDGDAEDPSSWTDDGRPFGMAETEITTQVDVGDFVEKKRSSLACHASQATDSSFFLEMPEDAFRATFGHEWFIHQGVPPGIREDALAGLG
jgi:LmbE family N-acetylglucosaminyl deacetylase